MAFSMERSRICLERIYVITFTLVISKFKSNVFIGNGRFHLGDFFGSHFLGSTCSCWFVLDIDVTQMLQNAVGQGQNVSRVRVTMFILCCICFRVV